MASLNSTRAANMSSVDHSGLFSTLEIGLILVAGTLSLVTVVGNILVMLSIKVCPLLSLFDARDDLSP